MYVLYFCKLERTKDYVPAHQKGPDTRPPGRPGADTGGESAQAQWGHASPGAADPGDS